jgi:hypothetical protein
MWRDRPRIITARRRRVGLALGQAEDVAVEPDRLVIVGGRDDEAQLADRTRIDGGHGASHGLMLERHAARP